MPCLYRPLKFHHGMNPGNRTIVPTADGSHTVVLPESGASYHSHHGAIQESMHVYIRAGLADALLYFADDMLRVLEVGFGTGLNAFLTALEADRLRRRIDYTAMEPFPLSPEEASVLNYPEQLGYPELFLELHAAAWEVAVPVTKQFFLHKVHTDLQRFKSADPFHLIYFDAFTPGAQPELWTEAVFDRMYELLLPSGILVTYCSKADVRRAMQAAGFTVEKLPGPWGKREILRAMKG